MDDDTIGNGGDRICGDDQDLVVGQAGPLGLRARSGVDRHQAIETRKPAEIVVARKDICTVWSRALACTSSFQKDREDRLNMGREDQVLGGRRPDRLRIDVLVARELAPIPRGFVASAKGACGGHGPAEAGEPDVLIAG